MSSKESLNNLLPPILITAESLIYHPLNYQISKLSIEIESQEYAACNFELSGLKIKHRQSKITPTKTGQFVTIWKRNETGITAPFNDQDDFDLLIISSKTEDHFGQFIFNKAILSEHKIISKNDAEGKRGIRVYPPWDTVSSKQAEKTQKWQVRHFLPVSINGNIDLALAKKLINA